MLTTLLCIQTNIHMNKWFKIHDQKKIIAQVKNGTYTILQAIN